jgi:hypothetical protein
LAKWETERVIQILIINTNQKKFISSITLNEEEAEKTCKQEETSATLVIIRSKDEQEFLTNLVFKTHKVVDNVWIGAKYTSNKFMWIDDSELSFTNWVERSPKNKTDDGCVQMQSEEASVGKWIDEPCSKNNKVLCQKMQSWSLSRLQKTLLDARKELQDSLENVTKQLNNQQSIINSQQTTINNLKQNPVPIGFIYVQLPNEKSPTEIWPWMTWKDITSSYAGLFFRAEGGGSDTFGSIQSENSSRLTAVTSAFNDYVINVRKEIIPGSKSDMFFSGSGCGGCTFYSLSFEVSGGEVRPRNMAIRVWKRTG